MFDDRFVTGQHRDLEMTNLATDADNNRSRALRPAHRQFLSRFIE